MENQDIRWKQRFKNFKKAFLLLKETVQIKKPSVAEQAGLIQFFEMTFELAWKTLKDYLEFQKVEAKFPRDAIKQGFKYDLLDDGDMWIDMLEKRNMMAHTYNETDANLALELIYNQFFEQLELFYNLLEAKIKDE